MPMEWIVRNPFKESAVEKIRSLSLENLEERLALSCCPSASCTCDPAHGSCGVGGTQSVGSPDPYAGYTFDQALYDAWLAGGGQH